MAFQVEKPKFFMGQKLSFDDTKKYIHSVPGPGSHEPNTKPTKYRAAAYTMGAKISPPKANTLVPGPGNYVNSAEKLK